jgi:membrane protein required for colicin V production
MSWLDIIIIVILVISLVTGLRTGIIKAVLLLAGVVIGVILAGRYYLPLADNLTFIPHEGATKILAFAIILIATMIVATIIGTLLTKIASALLLGWINRLGGAVLGLVLGGIFCGAALAIWVKFIGIAGVIADSAIAPILLKYLPLVLALLPGEFDVVRSFF